MADSGNADHGLHEGRDDRHEVVDGEEAGKSQARLAIDHSRGDQARTDRSHEKHHDVRLSHARQIQCAARAVRSHHGDQRVGQALRCRLEGQRDEEGGQVSV